MKKPELSLAPDRTPKEALERMREFTRRIVAVPKAEIQRPQKTKKKRHR